MDIDGGGRGCSCVGARKMSANAHASMAFASAFLAALIIIFIKGMLWHDIL